MKLNNTNPSGTFVWQKLNHHFVEEMQTIKMQDLFAYDTKRAEKFSIEWNDFLVDYSKTELPIKPSIY